MKMVKLLGIGLLSAMLLAVSSSTYADGITSNNVTTNTTSATTNDVFEGSTITVTDKGSGIFPLICRSSTHNILAPKITMRRHSH